jgi:hypothetical protein
MTSPAVDPLHLSDHDSEPEHEIDPFPVPVADPDSDYEPAVDLQSPSPPLPVHGQPLRGQPRGQARGQARGQLGQGQGAHNPACLLHWAMPVFHTMMHGYHIGCQDMGICLLILSC